MKIWFIIKRTAKLGAKSLWMHRLRSILTMLGIIFGVCSVIAMLAIGEGASREAQAQIARMGSGNIIVRTIKPPEELTGTTSSDTLDEYGLTYADARRFRATIPDVEVVVPLRRINQEAWYRNRKVAVEIVGTVPWHLDVTKIDLLYGRFLEDLDLYYSQGVCVVDEQVYERLFLFDDPLGTDVKLLGDYYRVIGVVNSVSASSQEEEESGGGINGNGGVAGNIYIPLTTARQRFGEIKVEFGGGTSGRQMERIELQEITVSVRPRPEIDQMDHVLAIRDVLDSLLSNSHKKKDYQIIVPLELLRQAEESKRIFTIVLGSIAAISLLVGGIGIMNIMLATVSERTREIGIRRAMGAKRRDIVIQFLSETLMLTMTGGILGLVLGAIIPFMVTMFGNMPTHITGTSMILAFGVSGIIGVTFGWYPAYRAAHMDPIESLRHE